MVAIKIEMKMNFIIYIFLLLSCSSANQRSDTIYEVVKKKQQNIKKIERTGYELDKSNFISFCISEVNSETGEWIKRLVYFSPKNDWSEQIISSTDLSDGFYSDTLLFYKNNFHDKQVLIWKQEGEYFSYLNIFLFQKDNMIFIGDLCVGVNCKNCDSFIFPNNEIEVRELKNGFEILFKVQAIFRGSVSQEIPYHSVNIETDKLVFKYDGINSQICY